MAKVTPVTTLLHLRVVLEHFAEVDVEPGWLFFQTRKQPGGSLSVYADRRESSLEQNRP
jgi:hypothetical protein